MLGWMDNDGMKKLNLDCIVEQWVVCNVLYFGIQCSKLYGCHFGMFPIFLTDLCSPRTSSADACVQL